MQLASLTFLSILNLSYNQLVGMIPKGSQIQTFSETSFEGNNGLCGAPLSNRCYGSAEPRLLPLAPEDKHLYSEAQIFVSAVVGFIVGLGSFIGLLIGCKRWKQRYYKHVGQILERTFHLEER